MFTHEEWAFGLAWVQAMGWPSSHATDWLNSNLSKVRAGLNAAGIAYTARRRPIVKIERIQSGKLKRRLAAMRRSIDKVEELL